MKKLSLMLIALVAVGLASCADWLGQRTDYGYDRRDHSSQYDNNYYQNVGYSIDNRYVYYRGVVIRDADPRTFQDLGDGYGKDSRYVYYCGRRMEGVDPRSFNGRSSDRRAGQRDIPNSNNQPPRVRW